MSVGTRVREAMSLPPRGRYQVRAIRGLEANDGRGILGDIMGLGKTYEFIGWMAIRPDVRSVVIVCPVGVKYQIQDMLWDLARIPSCVMEGRTPYPPSEDVVIINYDILATAEWPGGKRTKGAKPRFPWMELLRSRPVDLVVMDEIQKIKNRQALRTQACQALSRGIRHVIGSSGTLIDKAPVEFFPILQMVAPFEFTSFWKYVMRYCEPKRAFRGRGWDFSGASNLEELHERIKPWLFRSTDRTGLPPKNRTVLPVRLANRGTYDEAEGNFLRWVKKVKGKKAEEKAAKAVGLAKLGVLKRMAGVGKVPTIEGWVNDYLEQNGDKVTIFAIHHEVIDFLRVCFQNAAVIDGRVTGKKRETTKKKYLTDPSCRVFIGQLAAAGEGLDGLQTVSSTVLFAEVGWNWSEHEQGEDRVLRPGQKAQSVNIYYVVGRNTVEEPILDLIQSKADIVNRVLHNEVLDPLFQRKRNVGSLIQNRGV